MLSELFQRLKSRRADDPLPELDERLAVGALLVRLAKADRHYALEEIVQIDRILAADFGLNPVEAAKMRATCEKIEKDAPQTDELTRLVQDNVSYGERQRLLDALWQVSLADRVVRPEEEAFLADMSGALGIAGAHAADSRTHQNR